VSYTARFLSSTCCCNIVFFDHVIRLWRKRAGDSWGSIDRPTPCASTTPTRRAPDRRLRPSERTRSVLLLIPIPNITLTRFSSSAECIPRGSFPVRVFERKSPVELSNPISCCVRRRLRDPYSGLYICPFGPYNRDETDDSALRLLCETLGRFPSCPVFVEIQREDRPASR